MDKSNKLDIAWNHLFTKYDILNEIEQNGVCKLRAEQIKEFREPRLMTKFDWSDARPKVFRENGLSVLPDSRGTYVIGKFKAYKKLEYEEVKPISVKMPEWIHSFDHFPVTSEAVALNIAQMTGMIDMIMGTNEGEPSAISTITGRLKSGELKYRIDLKDSKSPYSFSVHNSQVEIDAGFENLNNLLVIEAKNRIPQDFMIRQLYYPFRGYTNLNIDKKVLPVYLTHADNVYAFHVFEFTEPNNYSSIRRVKQVNFIVDQSLAITLENVKQISKDSPNLKDTITFPQADSLTRVLDMLQHLRTPKDKFELGSDYQFNERQGDYYGNALRYLGFASKVERKFELTKLGKYVADLPNSDNRNKIIIKQILSTKCFNLIFVNTLHNGGEFDNDYIDHVLLANAMSVRSSTTAKRRRSTVKNWLNWVLSTATAE